MNLYIGEKTHLKKNRVLSGHRLAEFCQVFICPGFLFYPNRSSHRVGYRANPSLITMNFSTHEMLAMKVILRVCTSVCNLWYELFFKVFFI